LQQSSAEGPQSKKPSLCGKAGNGHTDIDQRSLKYLRYTDGAVMCMHTPSGGGDATTLNQ
jgi:hypothetical protein